MIEPTDEMVRAFTRHFFTCFRDADVREALEAVLAIVERDQPMAKAAPGEDACGKPDPFGRRTCERRARHDVCIAWVPGGVDAWTPDYDGMAAEIEQLKAKLAEIERERCMEPRGHVFHPLAKDRPLPRCGARGFAVGPGCIRRSGHEGGHGYSDGSGEQDAP